MKKNNIKKSSATKSISNNDIQKENKYLNPDKTKQNGIDEIIREEPELKQLKALLLNLITYQISHP